MPGIFSVYDNAAGFHMPFFESENESTARRSFIQLLMKEDHPFSQFPENFTLWHVCNIDKEKGEVLPFKNGKTKIADGAYEMQRLEDKARENVEAARVAFLNTAADSEKANAS